MASRSFKLISFAGPYCRSRFAGIGLLVFGNGSPSGPSGCCLQARRSRIVCGVGGEILRLQCRCGISLLRRSQGRCGQPAPSSPSSVTPAHRLPDTFVPNADDEPHRNGRRSRWPARRGGHGEGISVHPGRPVKPLTTTTGAPGRYELTFENATGQGQGGGAVTSKPGYEDDYRYVVPAANAVQNFRLHPIMRVTAGATIRVTVLPDDGFCGLSDEWRCRKFRVVSPGTER